MKTRHRVIEVQMIIQTDTMEKEASGCSRMAKDMGAPITHMINTLYTDIPVYLQNKAQIVITHFVLVIIRFRAQLE